MMRRRELTPVSSAAPAIGADGVEMPAERQMLERYPGQDRDQRDDEGWIGDAETAIVDGANSMGTTPTTWVPLVMKVPTP